MRPIGHENLVQLDQDGEVSSEPVVNPDEALIAITSAELQLLSDELCISANSVAAGRQQHILLARANPLYGTRPGYLDELEARERGLELLRAGLPQLPETEA